jgi:hypothetical protein
MSPFKVAWDAGTIFDFNLRVLELVPYIAVPITDPPMI